MKRKRIRSNSKWAGLAGYSRAIRIGSWIEVSGTVAAKDGKAVSEGDPAAQTRFILEKISAVLKEAGGSMQNVVRTRIYVTDISHWESVARVHGAFFKDIRPVTSMVEVSGLIAAEYLVEIEARAYVESEEIQA